MCQRNHLSSCQRQLDVTAAQARLDWLRYRGQPCRCKRYSGTGAWRIAPFYVWQGIRVARRLNRGDFFTEYVLSWYQPGYVASDCQPRWHDDLAWQLWRDSGEESLHAFSCYLFSKSVFPFLESRDAYRYRHPSIAGACQFAGVVVPPDARGLIYLLLTWADYSANRVIALSKTSTHSAG